MNRLTQKALIVLFIIQTVLTGLVLLNMASINSKVNAIYRDSYSSAIVEDANKENYDSLRIKVDIFTNALENMGISTKKLIAEDEVRNHRKAQGEIVK